MYLKANHLNINYHNEYKVFVLKEYDFLCTIEILLNHVYEYIRNQINFPYQFNTPLKIDSGASGTISLQTNYVCNNLSAF